MSLLNNNNYVKIWTRRPPKEWTGSVAHYYETLLTEINQWSKLKEGGTIHTSPEIQSIFECLFQYSMNIDPRRTSLDYIGIIDGKWKLYIDSLFPVNKIILHKGTIFEQEIVVANLCG